MKAFNICGLGTALVDILVHVDEPTFTALDLERGTMRLVGADEQLALLARVPSNSALVSGGSVANSVIACAQLGGKGSLLSLVGDDRYGLFYKGECESLGIDLVNPPVVGANTGTCAAFITPDAERTMRTHLGVAADFTEAHLDRDAIRRSEWLFIEGYVLANGEASQKAALRAAEIAAAEGCKVALTCSEAWVIETFGEVLNELLKRVDLVFTNEGEALALTGRKTAAEAFAELSERLPSAVVTCGPQGAFIAYNGTKGHVEAFPCTPVDLTGAGDMFAGTFLYCVTHGVEPLAAGKAACFLSKQVITRVGARLHTETRGYLEEVLGGAAPPRG